MNMFICFICVYARNKRIKVTQGYKMTEMPKSSSSLESAFEMD